MGVSLKPSTFVEGGAVPVDIDLDWSEVGFNIFDYQGKAPATVALRVLYKSDDGQEFEQQYSVGSPDRYTISEDGKTIDGPALTKGSNASLLLNALINSGFPENRLTDDISLLAGLRTHNIGLPEPTRSGLAPRAVDPNNPNANRPKVLSVPSQVIRLPWEKKGTRTIAKPVAAVKKATTAAAAVAEADEEGGDAVNDAALALVASTIEGKDSVTRQDLAQAVFAKLKKDSNRDAVAQLIFSGTFPALLAANGYAIDGEDISKG